MVHVSVLYFFRYFLGMLCFPFKVAAGFQLYRDDKQLAACCELHPTNMPI